MTLEQDNDLAALLMDRWLGVDFRGTPYAGLVVRDDTNRPVGVVILNEVRDGEYCIMPLTHDYLCRKYEGVPLVKYMRAKYRGQNWDFLA